MKNRGSLAIVLLLVSHGLAADLSAIPQRPIAVKKELLFADDFDGEQRSGAWHRVVPTFAFEQGALKGKARITGDLLSTGLAWEASE